jgi:hypothetical protein
VLLVELVGLTCLGGRADQPIERLPGRVEVFTHDRGVDSGQLVIQRRHGFGRTGTATTDEHEYDGSGHQHQAERAPGLDPARTRTNEVLDHQPVP